MSPPLASKDIAPGTELPGRETGPWSSAHVVRWCAAQQNWDRVHHDADYARRVAGLPHPIVNGALKQNLIVLFLLETMPDGAWIHEVDWTSLQPDFVGDALRLEGRIDHVRRSHNLLVVNAKVDIRNRSIDRITSSARATVFVAADGSAIADAMALADEPFNGEATPVAQHIPPAGLPPTIAAQIGRQLEHVRSCTPVDLGRLRLFADALGCTLPIYFEPQAGISSIHGSVVALPWFPTHALSMLPGAKMLSTHPRAMGREAVCEVGRDIASLLGVPPQGLRSAGNRGRFHSLVRAGETVEATSRLLSVQRLQGEGDTTELLVRTRNDYRTTGGRALLSEVTCIGCRTPPAAEERTA